MKGTTIQDTPRPQHKTVSLDPGATHPSQQAARLDYVLRDVPGAVIITDREGRIHSMNRAAKALLGQPANDLALSAWPDAFNLYVRDGSELFPAENLPPLRALNGVKDVPSVDMLLRSPVDEKDHRVSMSAGAILAEDGSLDGVTALIQEIVPEPHPDSTPRKHARRAEGLYRFTSLLTENADDVNRIASSVAAVVSDIIGDISAVALIEPGSTRLSLVAAHDGELASAARFRELAVKEIDFGGDGNLENTVIASGSPISMVPSEITVGPSSVMFGKFIEEMKPPGILMVPLIGRTGAIGTITLLRRNGGMAYTAGDRSFLMDIANRTALAIENCLLFDSLQAEISARLTAAKALDLSEERFQSIFASTSLGIKILDLNGSILETNAAFERIIGYTQAEILGKPFYDFLHPADMVRAVATFERLKREGASAVRFQHRAVHKNGAIVWVNAIFSAVRSGGGDQSLAFIVSILEDVTEQKKFESEMSELKNRLQSTMELERLRLAHELHDGPMQELYSIVYEVEELRGKSAPEFQDTLRKIGEDIHRVVGDLRDTAKELRPPTISQFGLEKTIRSYMADMRDKYPELTMHLALTRDQQLLPEDVRLALFRVLQQAFTNIVRHAQATEVSVRFSFDAEEARLEISDNGKGFPVPNTWIDYVREGHFGLAGAAERINALGGTFAVESHPRVSTTVRAVIPWKEHIE